MSMLEAARHYVNLGMFIFPVAAGTKEPLVPWRDMSTIDPAKVEAWWGEGCRFEGANIGIDCGSSELVVIDYDDLAGIDRMTEDLGWRMDEQDTAIARTPRGGLHVYWQAPGDLDIRNSQSKLTSKVDVRGDGGYVLAAPSTTPEGTYEWVGPAMPAPMPDRLRYVFEREAEQAATWEAPAVEALPTPSNRTERWAQVALDGELDAVASAPDGTRNHRLFIAGLKLYGAVKSGYLDGAHVTAALTDVAVNRAGQTPREADQTLRSAWERADPRGPGELDLNLAPRLVDPPRPDAPDDGEPGFEILGLAELADLPPPVWVLENRIPEGLTWLIGHPKVGKSFVAADLALTVASQGKRVLYMAGEGVHGFAKRIIAWSEAHPTAKLDTFGVSPVVPRLLDGDSIATFYRTVKRFRPDLVVIDTWSRATPGADENSHKDSSLAIDHVDRARAAYGCSVLIVHHTNVAGARARGHTSLDGAADAIWHVKRPDEAPDVIEIENTAMKDYEQVPTLLARLATQGASAVLTPSQFDRQGWK